MYVSGLEFLHPRQTRDARQRATASANNDKQLFNESVRSESKTRGEKVFTVAKIIIYFVLFHGSDRI